MIKFSTLKFTALIALIPLLGKAQDSDSTHSPNYHIPKYHPPFLSLRNPRIAIGAGFEGAFPQMMKSTVNPSGLSIKYKDTHGGSSYPYISGGVSFDIYSDNSLVGLFGSINYSASTTTYKQEQIATDYFSINRVEVPVYLKLRPGSIAGSSHLWFLFGGIFSMPVSINRRYTVDYGTSTTPDGAVTTFTDTNISQVNDLFLVSTSAGYETYFGSSLRGAIFLSASYSLNSQFNTDYVQYRQVQVVNDNIVTPGGQSTLASYPGYRSHEIRITIGTRFFLKLSKNKLKLGD